MPALYHLNMAAPLRIQLTPEEDRLLLELSLDPKTHKKTRLWAMMVRLAAEGWTAPRIAQHFHKDRTTVYLVLRRFLREGLQGLVYRKPPGAPRKFTPERPPSWRKGWQRIRSGLPPVAWEGRRRPSSRALSHPTFLTPFTPAGNIARPPGGAPRSRDGEPG